jgi:hypothetical protein
VTARTKQVLVEQGKAAVSFPEVLQAFAAARAWSTSWVPRGLQSKKDPPRPFECFVWHPPEQQPVPSQHVDPHGTRPAGHWHAPPVQVAVVGQALPQAPQFARSVWRSLQTPLQLVWPVGQQSPFEQAVPVPQVIPQPPQLASSVFVSTQDPPQFTRPTAQHFPLEQAVPDPQAIPQPPQLASSVFVSTHSGDWLGQLVAPALQVQVPPPQVPRPQACPQAPQFFTSTEASTHSGELPAHLVAPASQAQAPPPQVPRPQA